MFTISFPSERRVLIDAGIFKLPRCPGRTLAARGRLNLLGIIAIDSTAVKLRCAGRTSSPCAGPGSPFGGYFPCPAAG